MSFDLEKLQAVAELGEVIRLQNEALERLIAFRKARPYLMMPNLAKMVEENIKENVTVLYKELNNLHKPPTEQVRYICKECQMAFVVALPGGICDECRARLGSKPRDYVLPETISDFDNEVTEESQPATTESAPEQNADLAAEAADEVAHDLSVAEPIETPATDEPDTADSDNENVYELPMDDTGSLEEIDTQNDPDDSLPGNQ